MIPSSKDDTDLFDLNQTRETILETSPDLIITAAAKVGGFCNNTYRAEFILDNLKININILEAIIDNPQIKLINQVVVVYIH